MIKTHKHAFTLIELLIVMAIILVLAGLVLAGVGTMRDNADKLQVSSAIGNVNAALLLHKSINNQLPAADDSFYLDYDPLLDGNDPLNNTDSAYATWPVLNKLSVHNGLQLDHELLQDNGSKKRMFDNWDQEIRYVIGAAQDDNTITVEGKFPDWNWDSVNSKAHVPGFPYVYSYGPDNPDGSDDTLWIYEVSQ